MPPYLVMGGLLFLLSLAVSLGLPYTAPADAEAAGLEAKQAKVSIWPEYDDPRVLVIEQADLADATSLPTTVSFNIPKGAEIGMACEITPSGGHNCKPYQLADQGDYQTLTYTVDSEHKVFMEYYYEAFPSAPGAHSFEFDLRPSFPVSSLTLEVQQPARSTDFTVTPELAPQGADADSLNYFSTEIASPAVGEAVPVSISYSKPDIDTSVEPAAEGAPAGGGLGTSATSATGGSNTLLIVVVGIGLAIVAFVAYRSYRPSPVTGRAGSTRTRRGSGHQARGSERSALSSRLKKQARGPAKGQATGAGRSTKYCTQCGEELHMDDRFCVSCGTPTAR